MKIANSALRQCGAERFQFETPLRNAASAKHISYYNLLKQIKHTNRLAFWLTNKKSQPELTLWDIKRWILRSFLLLLRYRMHSYSLLLNKTKLTINPVLIYCVTACSATALPEFPGPNGDGSSRLLDPAASWIHPAKQRVQTRRSPRPQNRRVHYP